MSTLKVCLTMLLVFGVAEAQEILNHKNVDVYRSADGQLTAESLKNVAQLREKAARQGYVTLWLTANVPFNPDTDELSDQQIAEQNQQVRNKFSEILQPLVEAGKVWHEPERPDVEGPGCLVRANASGLARLVRDTRLLNIHEVE